MVENWSISTRAKSSTMPTMNLEGIVGEDELSCQSTNEVGIKEVELHYEGLFVNEKLIQDGQLLRIYTKLLEALNEIRLQIATNYQPVMKFKGKSFNTFIAQVKAKEFVTDVDDVEFEDWCVTNTHAYFWYCADVSKSPLFCWFCLIRYNQVQCFEFVLSAQLCYILYRNAKRSYSFKYAGLIDAVGSANTVRKD
jgi:hypothetical protein